MGRAVLLGAGHAHLHTLLNAASFVRRGHDLVVVAPDRFWYSGLATGMLGGHYPPELDQVDVEALVTAGGGRFVRAHVAGINPLTRTVRLINGATISYDTLSINIGSETPEIPGADCPRVYSVKPIRRLCDLRADLETSFRVKPAHTVHAVVAGGGVTACELAANLVALGETRRGRIEVTVVAAGRLLSQLPDPAMRSVIAGLERRGVTFRRGARVSRIANAHAELDDGGRLSFDVFLNATGLRPNSLLRKTGLPVDDAGALRVDRHLRSIADAYVHGGGDCVALEGRELPRIGVYAIRQAPVLYSNLLAALEGAPPRTFRPQIRYLWIMNLGNGTGLAARGGIWWEGRMAFWLKDAIDRRFLRRYQHALRSPQAT